MSEQLLQGGCLCGQVRYSVAGEPVFAAICHCSMCRRAHAAPAVAWAMFTTEQLTFSGELRAYQSSAEAQRHFCAKCGSQISFTASFLPGLIDIAIASFDDPECVRPHLHYWCANKLSWAEFADDLPRHEALPPMGDEA